MAEVITTLGLVSSIIQLIDFGIRVISRLHDFKHDTENASKIPTIFVDIMNQLPLLLHALQQTKENAEAGHITHETKVAISSAVQGCQNQLQELEKLLANTLPKPGSGRWKRLAKAISSIGKDKAIVSITTKINQYIQLLTFHRVTSVPSYVKNPKGYFHVPFDRDIHFIEREELFHEMDLGLKAAKRVALAGVGGIGKSQIAIEYCYRFRDCNPQGHVFWIHSSTRSRLLQGYYDVSRILTLPGRDEPTTNIFELVSDWLNDQRNGPWLLVLDSADDFSTFKHSDAPSSTSTTALAKSQTDIEWISHIPRNPDGITLLTTRDRRIGLQIFGLEPIKVPPMSLASAHQLLQTRVHNVKLEKSSIRLLNLLEHIPLAIIQAGSFIRQNGITLEEYIDAWEKNEGNASEMLGCESLYDPRRDFEASSSIFHTWFTSFEHLRRTTPYAAELLSTMVILDHEGLPKYIFYQEEEEGKTWIEFTQAWGILLSLSFIRIESNPQLFGMHRLVQVATQKWLERDGKLAFFQAKAVALISKAFPDEIPHNQEHYQKLYSHGQAVLKHKYNSKMNLIYQAKVFRSVAWYDCRLGRLTEALESAQMSLQMCESLLEKENLETLRSSYILGLVNLSRTEGDKAENLLRRTLHGFEKIWGWDNMETLMTASQLTNALRLLGETVEAEELCTRALSGLQKLVEPHDIRILNAKIQLAFTLLHQKRFGESEKYGREALEGMKEVLAPNDPTYLYTKSYFASILNYNCKYEEAASIGKEVFPVQEKILGFEHINTLATVNRLCESLQHLGQLEDAAVLCRRGMDSRVKILGWDNYDSLWSMHRLSLLLRDLGQYEEAESLARRTLEGREKVCGLKHQETIMSCYCLAFLLHGFKRYKEALKYYRRTWEDYSSEHKQTDSFSIAFQGRYLAVLEEFSQLESNQTIGAKATITWEALHSGQHPLLKMLTGSPK